MIDFTFTDNDEKTLAAVREEALLYRKYARHYEENEHEFPPDELPEASTWKPSSPPPDSDGPRSSIPVMAMLGIMGRHWGDYSVRLRQDGGALGNAALSASGTPEQKQRWGEELLAMAITEPGCGSDPSRVQTSAVLDEETDEWILNGEKIFVTTGCRATGVVVWATVDKTAGRAGIKSFLVMKGTPGFEVAHKEKKLGIRADDTATLVFRDCRIPRDQLLGLDETVKQKGSGGFRGVMKTFNMTRPAVAAMGLGIAEAALDFTREQLEAAGLEIDYAAAAASLPAPVARFVELEALFEASKLTVLRAAWLAGEGRPNNMESSVTKAHAGSAVRRITQGCIEILGPMGISREHLLEKWLRDCRITDIYEGTGQIQRLIIARGLLDYTREELK